MLYAIDSDGTPRRITRIPHLETYELCRNRLSPAQFQAIWDALNHRVEGEEIHTSSWIPGSDWTETAFQPIYELACGCDHDAAARFFGIVLWHVMMERPEAWGFGRYEKDGVPIEGMTYFRLPRLD